MTLHLSIAILTLSHVKKYITIYVLDQTFSVYYIHFLRHIHVRK